MHTEHKTLKWCAVLLALIIAIAAITLTALKTVPASAPVTVEIETIKAMPEEMADLTTDHNVELMAEETVKNENVQIKDDGAPDSAAGGLAQEGVADIQHTSAAPVNVTIKVDGMEMHLMAAPIAIGKVLESYGIPVGENDKVKPALDQQLTDDTEIKITRIVFEEVVESEVIPFKTKVEGTDELPAKTEKVVQKGQNGEDKVTYKVTYADGKEIARKEIARETVKKPVKKIIKRSTVGTINGAEYARKFTVKAYSYTGGGTTASGLPAAVGRIAVDPRVIPLGTRVYVEGYGFATAADTGGNIKGNTIDVYYNSESQCRQWGCRYITIYILK